jgi:hypothetical protein
MENPAGQVLVPKFIEPIAVTSRYIDYKLLVHHVEITYLPG